MNEEVLVNRQLASGKWLMLLLTPFLPTTGVTSEEISYLDRKFTEMVYPSDLTPSEVMVQEYQDIKAADPDANVRFRVAIQASKLGKAHEEMGLPVLRSTEGPDRSEENTGMLIEVSFFPSRFIVDKELDAAGFKYHVDEKIALLAVDERPGDPGPVCGRMIGGTLINVLAMGQDLKLHSFPGTFSEMSLDYECVAKGWRMSKIGFGNPDLASGP